MKSVSATSASRILASGVAGALHRPARPPGQPGVRFAAHRVSDQPLSYLSDSVAYASAPRSAMSQLRLQGGAGQQLEVVGDVLAAESRVLARIAELAHETATENWDDEAGQPILATQWNDASNLARRAVREMLDVPAPFPSACGDGTVHLQWTTPRGDRGVIEIGRNSYWWSFLSRTGEGDEVVQLGSPDETVERVRALFG